MTFQDKQAEIEFFNRVAEQGGLPPSPAHVYADLLELSGCSRLQNKLILDAGRCTGEHGLDLAEFGNEVVGVDISPKSVDFANCHATRLQRGSFKAVLGDLEDANLFQSGSFDVVFCLKTLHHFPDMAKVIRNSTTGLDQEVY